MQKLLHPITHSPTRRLMLVGSFLVLFAAAVPGRAETTGSIRGVVRDATGAVLRGVTMTLFSPSRPQDAHSTSTDQHGAYQFPGLESGRYVLEASLSGFETARREIDLEAGDDLTVDLPLFLSGLVETITVTASRTGQTDLRSTPLAITAVQGETLQGGAIDSLENLAYRAPALTISQNTGFAQVTIRGIGTNAVFAGADPSSTVHLDGVYLARPSMVFSDLFDVERVEILHGPQGTLYGRNSVGGNVNIITQHPTPQFQGSANLRVGDYRTFRFDGSLSGPILKNKLMGRVAFVRGVRDGFVRDLNHTDTPLGGTDTLGVRGQLRWVFGEGSQLLFSGDYATYNPVPLSYSKIIFDRGLFPINNPSDLHEVRHSDVGFSDKTQVGGSAGLTLRLSDTLTFSSLSAYRRSNYHVQFDADMTELRLLTTDIDERQWQVSQEATLVGNTKWTTWLGGLYYFREEDRQPVNARLHANRLDQRIFPTVNSRAWAGFGQLTFPINQLSLTAGLRFTHEEKEIESSGGLYLLGTPQPADPTSIYALHDRIVSHSWTPRFVASFQASPDLLVYGSATRGFKSGGFNFTAPEPGRGYQPEYAMCYEAGLKTTLATGRIRINAAGFYSDYNDLQVQAFIRPGVIDISNAASARIKGIEIETTAVPTPRLRLAASLAYLNATYDRYIAIGPGGLIRDVTGNHLNNAPAWAGTASARYALPAGRLGEFSWGAEVYWQSRVFFTPFNDAIETQEPYGLLNLYGAFTPENRRWEISVNARNLSDTDYITGTASFPPPGVGGFPGVPRTVAVQLKYRY